MNLIDNVNEASQTRLGLEQVLTSNFSWRDIIYMNCML